LIVKPSPCLATLRFVSYRLRTHLDLAECRNAIDAGNPVVGTGKAAICLMKINGRCAQIPAVPRPCGEQVKTTLSGHC
jgi:hypothetical protein